MELATETYLNRVHFVNHSPCGETVSKEPTPLQNSKGLI